MVTDQTVAEETQKLVQFLRSLPPGTNPYTALRDYLVHDVTLPMFSPYAVGFLRAILFAHVVLAIQSAVLLYLRLVLKRSKCIALTRQGLLRPDMPSATAISNLLYSMLAIADLSLQEAMDRSRTYISPKFLIFGLKFLFLLSYAWSYIWGCLCTCTSLLWDERWTTQEVMRGKKTQMPTLLKFFLNAFYLALFILPWPPVAWAFGSANSEMLKLRDDFAQIKYSLNVAGKDYNSTASNLDAFLPFATSAAEVLNHELTISHYTRLGLSMFLGSLVFLVLVYAPLLSFSFGNLRNRINAYEKVLPASPPDCQQQLYEALQDLKQEHRTLFKQAMVTYFTVVFYIPILSWELTFQTNRFLEERTRWVVIPLLIHGLYAVTGNVIVGLVVFQTLRHIRKLEARNSLTIRNTTNTYVGEVNRPYRLQNFFRLSHAT